MQLLAILLIVCSAILHAIWNTLAKKSSNKQVFTFFLLFLGSFIFFPFYLAFIGNISIPLYVWGIIIASAVLQVLYFYSLSKTYDNSYLSLAYPITRSSTIFVPLLAFIFLGEKISARGIIGILIILLGIFGLHLKTANLKQALSCVKTIGSKGTSLALLTAFFSASYAVIDKFGVTVLHPFVYNYLITCFASLMFIPLIIKSKEEIKKETKSNLGIMVLSAILVMASYLLVLFAFQIDNASYVIALRQISVVFGVLFGSIFLKEAHGKMRIIASIIMMIGFVLISTA